MGQSRGKQKAASCESGFTLAELVKGARSVFGVSPECVAAALQLAGVTRATETQARAIVEHFMNQEV